VSALLLSPAGAYSFLTIDDKLLAHACRIEAYQASGPGGQKRNRTYSAIRLTHSATGISVIAEESRSQNENRLKALRRLRMAIALRVRKQPGGAGPAIPETITVYFKQDTLWSVQPYLTPCILSREALAMRPVCLGFQPGGSAGFWAETGICCMPPMSFAHTLISSH
jgi:hypothetical protein